MRWNSPQCGFRSKPGRTENERAMETRAVRRPYLEGHRRPKRKPSRNNRALRRNLRRPRGILRIGLGAVFARAYGRAPEPLLKTRYLIPLDEPIFLWYSSFRVQFRLIPVLPCAHLSLSRYANCPQFSRNISPFDPN